MPCPIDFESFASSLNYRTISAKYLLIDFIPPSEQTTGISTLIVHDNSMEGVVS